MSTPSLQRVLSSRGCLISIALLAHIPILIQYALRMWRAEHYQFFPLMVLGVAWFFTADIKEIANSSQPGKPWVVGVLFAIISMLLFVGTVLNSSFVGAVSCWLLLASSVYWLFGKKGILRSVPYLLLLGLIIPLPARIDEWIIFKMQFLASGIAGGILDSLGQVHFREGVVLITENDKFLTEEACSGIRSLFSSLAAIGFYCLINYYPLWRYGFNLIQTMFWVLIGNALRIALVVFISDNWTTAVSSGWGHDALGYGSLAFILAMAVSTDRLLQFFVMKRRLRSASLSNFRSNLSNMSTELGPWSSFFARLEYPKVSVVYHLGFVSVLAVGILVAIQNFGEAGTLWINNLPRLAFPTSADLRIEGSIVREFEHVHRGKGNIQAEDSFVWQIEKEDLHVKFSLDCPWDDWHDLSHCYSGLGWNVAIEHCFESSDQSAGFSVLQLTKPTGEVGLVFFSSVDRFGNEVVPRFSGGYYSPTSVFRQAVGLGRSALNSESKGIKLPVTTFQLVCIPDRKLGSVDREALKRLFFQCRNALLKSERFESTP